MLQNMFSENFSNKTQSDKARARGQDRAAEILKSMKRKTLVSAETNTNLRGEKYSSPRRRVSLSAEGRTFLRGGNIFQSRRMGNRKPQHNKKGL
jgi:hypothetical protein